MKTTILIAIMLFTSATLSAKDTIKDFDFTMTNIKVFNDEAVPALSMKLNSKSSKKLDIKLTYTNKLLIKQIQNLPTKAENPEVQNLYVSLKYKF